MWNCESAVSRNTVRRGTLGGWRRSILRQNKLEGCCFYPNECGIIFATDRKWPVSQCGRINVRIVPDMLLNSRAYVVVRNHKHVQVIKDLSLSTPKRGSQFITFRHRKIITVTDTPHRAVIASKGPCRKAFKIFLKITHVLIRKQVPNPSWTRSLPERRYSLNGN